VYTEDEMLNEGRVFGAVGRIRAFAPRFDVAQKRESLWHRVVGFLFGLLGAPGYMNSFWTTVGFRAAAPGVDKPYARPPWKSWDWRDVWHEGRHAVYATRLTRTVMWLVYSFPQCLCLPLAFLAGLHSLWWLLPALLVLAPLPAPGRLWIELRCYAVQIVIAQELRETANYSVNEVLNTTLCQRIIANLSSAAYYWAAPTRRLATWFLARHVRRVCVDRRLDLYEQAAVMHARRIRGGR
jgi:hypothetical protein